MGSGAPPLIAVDTNIVVRYAVKDDPEQTRLATEFLRENRCRLLPTVVLEAGWVLGSKRGYGLEAATRSGPPATHRGVAHRGGGPSASDRHGTRVV